MPVPAPSLAIRVLLAGLALPAGLRAADVPKAEGRSDVHRLLYAAMDRQIVVY